MGKCLMFFFGWFKWQHRQGQVFGTLERAQQIAAICYLNRTFSITSVILAYFNTTSRLAEAKKNMLHLFALNCPVPKEFAYYRHFRCHDHIDHTVCTWHHTASVFEELWHGDDFHPKKIYRAYCSLKAPQKHEQYRVLSQKDLSFGGFWWLKLHAKTI